jgi:hypothetical protein
VFQVALLGPPRATMCDDVASVVVLRVVPTFGSWPAAFDRDRKSAGVQGALTLEARAQRLGVVARH